MPARRMAGVAVAAGFHTSRLDGTPLVYNNPSPWLPDLVVCRPELIDRVLAAVDPPATDHQPTRSAKGTVS